jgi:sigma-B regulation protein RsbU (phosphoserine phosphatase)
MRNRGTVLGVSEELDYDLSRCSVEAGDILVLYTDGVTETRNPNGRFFDIQKLMDSIDRCAALPAQEIAGQVVRELTRFSRGEPSDDRTLIVYRQINGIE